MSRFSYMVAEDDHRALAERGLRAAEMTTALLPSADSVPLEMTTALLPSVDFALPK